MADAKDEGRTTSEVGKPKVMNNERPFVQSSVLENGGLNLSSTFENVDLNVDGDIEDAGQSEEEGGSSDVSARPKRKVKRKRKSKSLQHSTEETDSSTDSEYSATHVSHAKANQVNPKDLTWPMWLWYYVVAISVGAFHVAEYMGEKLADFFGITTPKYQYVIDEYYRMKREEQEEKEREEREQLHVLKRQAQRIAEVEGGEPNKEGGDLSGASGNRV